MHRYMHVYIGLHLCIIYLLIGMRNFTYCIIYAINTGLHGYHMWIINVHICTHTLTREFVRNWRLCNSIQFLAAIPMTQWTLVHTLWCQAPSLLIGVEPRDYLHLSHSLCWLHVDSGKRRFIYGLRSLTPQGRLSQLGATRQVAGSL